MCNVLYTMLVGRKDGKGQLGDMRLATGWWTGEWVGGWLGCGGMTGGEWVNGGMNNLCI